MKFEKIKINEIQPAEYNPRIMPPNEYNKLKKSLDTYGLVDPIIIDLKHDNTIIGGHQRYQVLIDENPEQELQLLQLGDIGLIMKETNITLNDINDQKALNLALNKISGDWDYKLLDDLLQELQEDHYDIDLTGFDIDDLEMNLDEFELSNENITSNTLNDEIYSTNIQAPIYEITGENPSISELYSDKKYKHLMKKIEKVSDKDLKLFLEYAASRHIQFNFSKIAEFYAHQDKEIQTMMEDSALIVIDFNKAIEEGFAHISEEYKKQLEID